jgi:hypothetical protein
MCQQEHLCLTLHVSRGIVFGSGIKNTAHILADVARQKAAVNLPQAFRKYVQTPERLLNLHCDRSIGKEEASRPHLCLYRCDRKWF